MILVPHQVKPKQFQSFVCFFNFKRISNPFILFIFLLFFYTSTFNTQYISYANYLSYLTQQTDENQSNFSLKSSEIHQEHVFVNQILVYLLLSMEINKNHTDSLRRVNISLNRKIWWEKELKKQKTSVNFWIFLTVTTFNIEGHFGRYQWFWRFFLKNFIFF